MLGIMRKRESNGPRSLVYCEDCKHCFGEKGYPYAKCGHPSIRTGLALVTQATADQYCSVARDLDSLCGKDARYFEPAERPKVDVSELRDIKQSLNELKCDLGRLNQSVSYVQADISKLPKAKKRK